MAALARSTISKINELRAKLQTPLTSPRKMTAIAEIETRIGTLSVPSKMPWYSWSISANRCITGSKLAKIEGTPCSLCYACKGRYRFDAVQSAQERRYAGWANDPDWSALMAIMILYRTNEPGAPHFRWFDSGDLQGPKMFQDIVQVALDTPDVYHWLPTQERSFVDWEVVPDNLLIRISASKIGGASKTSHCQSSIGTTFEDGIYPCPARHQQNQCGECRACWDPTVNHVRYAVH